MSDLNDGRSLLFGDLELIDPNNIECEVKTLAEGTTWGNPQPIEVAVRSLMMQGSNVVTQGWDNRDDTSVRVKFKATNLDIIAAYEQKLMAQIGKRNTLTWTPPDGLGAPTQFVIVTSSLNYLPNDVAEVLYPPSAQYSIRLIAEPFPRSTIVVRAPALPESGDTRHVVDDCTDATNWTGYPTAPTVVAGRIEVESGGSASASATRAGTIDTSALKYLETDWEITTPVPTPLALTDYALLRAFTGDRELARVGQTPFEGAVSRRSIFLVPDDLTSLDEVRFEQSWRGSTGGTPLPPTPGPIIPTPPDDWALAIDQVSVSDIRPSIGTSRQLSQVIEVEGSAPTEGALLLEHDTDALGEVLVYVCPDEYPDYSPAMRQYRVAGATPTPDATTVSGALNSLATGDTFEIPAPHLPDGTFALMALVRVGAPDPGNDEINWSAVVVIDDHEVGETTSGATSITGLASGAVTIGDLQLPDWQIGDQSSAVVRVTLQSDASGLQLDEAWLFNVDIGYLTHVRCGTGTPASDGASNRIWLLPATIDTNIPKVLRGHAEDQSDAYQPAASDLGSWMPPYFEPTAARVHTVCTGAENVRVFLEHQPRWHTRARRVIGQ